MNWSEREGLDDWHVVWILTNDKGELLARIEGFGGAGTDLWYPWIMDTQTPGLLRRVGPSAYRKIEDVKAYCERVLAGELDQNHKTAAVARDGAYRGEMT